MSKFGSHPTAETESVPDQFLDEDTLSDDLYQHTNNDLEDNCSVHSSTGRTTKSGSEEDDDGKLQFAKRETQAVLRLRLLVFDFLIVATIAVSLITYFTSTSAEMAEYNSQYDAAAEKVMDAFMDIAVSKLAAVSGLAVTMAAHAEETQSLFPFVTLSRFQERAATYLDQSGALYIHVSPLVVKEQRKDWELYVTGNESLWIEEGLQYQDNIGLLNFTDMPDKHEEHDHIAERWPIWFHNLKGLAVTDKGQGPYLPTWQTTPIVYNGQEVNENILKSRRAYIGANLSLSSRSVVVDKFLMAPPGSMNSTGNQDTEWFSLLLGIKQQQQVYYPGDPLSQVFVPVFDTLDKESQKAVGVQTVWIRWLDYFKGILPEKKVGIYVVLSDSCGGNFTYIINGKDVVAAGEGDQHQRRYDDMVRTTSLESVTSIDDGTEQGLPIMQGHCNVNVQVYPSNEFHSIYNTNIPAFMTAAVVLIFVCTALLFIMYDRLVERRQRLVMANAEQTNAIVSSLFPKQVRDRLMQQAAPVKDANGRSSSFMAPNRRLKGYLNGVEDDDMCLAPIADLFPHCTVLFADISGFTAWSSTRDPAQVFILLQTVYQAFDRIAKRRKVFKVETIGDSYVAVTGLPEPQEMHAVIMSRFAAECRIKMNQLVNQLETSLGPDTADLSMRFGLHSGPVTAGVLRGERARFQLFGDTVNTAARMESTGERDMIQISHITYELLLEAGKHTWVKPRLDCVKAKGKGTLRTYWLQISGSRKASSNSDENGSAGLLLPADSSDTLSDNPSPIPASVSTGANVVDANAAKKQARLVNWMVELFKEHIQKMLAQRSKPSNRAQRAPRAHYTPRMDQTSLDEVAEVIYLPRFNAKTLADVKDPKFVPVSPIVIRQLHKFITTIANHYLDNPFHNFEHACHVTMATNKFLKRIVTPDLGKGEEKEMAAKMHDYTHGINSDPLTLLAIVFSALIHDVDHRGVSNGQLVKENQEMFERYGNKSVAEQNSLDLAWDLLMGEQFEELRDCLFTNNKELYRFRQVIVNVVLATDIFDPELNGLRKKRWERAFSTEISDDENRDLRATIVIEHIIQASDVSHTMQHWHIYRKWNQRLFLELYRAYCEGRMAKDPSEFWYKGEIGFFDNYIIPLAKKLKDCQVFGVSSDECLNYAIQNRDEWKEKGQEIVAEMMQDVTEMEMRPL
ncbi:Receptor-type guanylate cyclase gcy [Seminavis robusta]|uniref:Receptor-type guanylate cyclase gcy n=1 Tax=Seminavis robusta TaxID=568900 RepID=A0A9N8HKN5_9STRA|nr:Receptor-type guanylate cyclase gcy [Seminavis robusta]|eukprot:Sro853_g211150.1 Receptor-type guanylate cyclase gcy (1188) ;mRNA; r:24170-29101